MKRYEREIGTAFQDQLDAGGRPRAGVLTSAVADVLLTAPGVHLDLLRQDLRYAWRTLTARAQRSFALASVLTLALGIRGAVVVLASGPPCHAHQSHTRPARTIAEAELGCDPMARNRCHWGQTPNRIARKIEAGGHCR